VDAQRVLAQFEVRSSGGDAKRLEELRANAVDAERRWAAAAPREASAVAPLEVGLTEVRAALKPDAVLVAFATVKLREGPYRLFAFAASGNRSARDAVRSFRLGEIAKIAESLAEWRALAGRSPQGDAKAERACRDAGRRLRALTWDVIAPAVGAAHDVYLVPEGPLHALPWGALPDGDRGYLVENKARIHVLDAERDLIREDAAGASSGLLALGDVDFDGESPAGENAPLQVASARAVLVDCTGVPSAFPRLPETGREVDAIAQEWTSGQSEVLRGADATETMFKLLAPGRQVLHLATHGVVLEDSCAAAMAGTRGVGGVAPLAKTPSARAAALDAPPSPWLGRRVLLALAGANHAREHERDENEGLLTAEEVTTMDLRGTDWVVLSACQSGVAEVWDREGRLGMTRAFHLAGARAVIASQWPVDDESTREWMSALYAARGDGATRAGDAIQAASRAILKARRGDGRSTHPFYWAAFTASGD
jgi:CHAT domain-containing protein